MSVYKIICSFSVVFVFLEPGMNFSETDNKRNEVTGEGRKLHSGKLHNLYSPPNIVSQIDSRKMWWAGHVARMGERRKLYKVLVGKLEENRPL
jgi:hypothetical protein